MTDASKKYEAELERIEKLSVILHEAGHLTVALAAGRMASAAVWKSNSTDKSHRSWAGSTRVGQLDMSYLNEIDFDALDSSAGPIDLGTAELKVLPDPPEMGAAGVAAECLFADWNGEDITKWEIDPSELDPFKNQIVETIYYGDETPSETDCEALYPNGDRDDADSLYESVSKAVDILIENREVFNWAVNLLVEHETTGDDTFLGAVRRAIAVSKRKAQTA